MHNGTRCALDGTAFPACRYQTQGVSRPSDVIIFFPSTIWLFCHACCVNGTHARTHANKRKEKKTTTIRLRAWHAQHHEIEFSAPWLAAGWLGLNLPKKKNKRDSPRSHNHDFATHDSIPDAMGLLSCPTHYAGAAFPRSLRRFEKGFFCCCLSSLSSTLPYLTSR